jgi:hypothetical protein
MHYIVEEVEFDFDGEDTTFDDEIAARDTALGMWWVDAECGDPESELVDKITEATGWCIKSIKFCENRPHSLTSYL